MEWLVSDLLPSVVKGVAVVLLLVGLLGYAGILAAAYLFGKEKQRRILEAQPGHALGLPVSAVAAFVIVVTFDTISEGTLKVKALGFEFEGPSGPIIMWVICFLALVTSLWALRSK